MSLDVNKLKARLADIVNRNANKGGFEKIDYAKIYWKPKLGKQYVRILPSKFNKDYPLTEVYYHENIVKRQMYALTNWGERDPIVEFARQMQQAPDKESKDLGRKLNPKKKTFVQVLVRGEEELGARLWQFGPRIEEQILRIITQVDEYGDITDIQDGRDLIVEGNNATFQRGKDTYKYVEPSIVPKGKSTPITEDPEFLKKILDEQHDPLSLGKKWSFEELKGFLGQWLSPEDTPTKEAKSEEDDDLPVSVDENDGEDTPPWKTSAVTNTTEEDSRRKKINELFKK